MEGDREEEEKNRRAGDRENTKKGAQRKEKGERRQTGEEEKIRDRSDGSAAS